MKQASLNLDLSARKTRKQVVPEPDGPSGSLNSAGRADCPLLPRGQDWQTTFFVDDHAARPFHAAMVYLV